jgi:Poxvirus Late Transcription Factor VLTF3 like
MEVQIRNCDLLQLHNAINSYLTNKVKNQDTYISQLINIVTFTLKSKLPYGVNSHDIEKIKAILEFYNIDLNDILNEKTDIPLTYAQWKENLVKIRDLQHTIDDINFQVPMTLVSIREIIDDYNVALATPVKKSFINDNKINNSNSCNSDFNIKYYDAIKYCIPENDLENIVKTVLAKSVNVEKFVYENDLSSDQNCANEVSVSSGDDEDCCVFEGINFQDLTRVNINSKYKYEKRCHFRDTIKQYQAQQQKTIPDKVFEDVKKMIEAQGLLSKDPQNPYSRVTKAHIRQFLNETDNSKYYEDLQLIYSKITGKDPPNITMYEKQLYKDFDELVDAYIKLKLKRKNFLNSHYVLKQLLRRQKYKVPEGDLTSLKTPNRQREHDDIFQQCCEILGWNFSNL